MRRDERAVGSSTGVDGAVLRVDSRRGKRIPSFGLCVELVGGQQRHERGVDHGDGFAGFGEAGRGCAAWRHEEEDERIYDDGGEEGY